MTFKNKNEKDKEFEERINKLVERTKKAQDTVIHIPVIPKKSPYYQIPKITKEIKAALIRP